jgi:hypothetical protein
VHDGELYLATSSKTTTEYGRTFKLIGSNWTQLTGNPYGSPFACNSAKLFSFYGNLYLAMGYDVGNGVLLFNWNGTDWDFLDPPASPPGTGTFKTIDTIEFNDELYMSIAGGVGAAGAEVSTYRVIVQENKWMLDQTAVTDEIGISKTAGNNGNTIDITKLK